MRICMVLLLVVFIAPAAFSQLMSKPKPPAAYVAPALDPATKDAIQKAIWNSRGEKSKPMFKVEEVLGGDKIPNGFKAELPLTVYMGNNIYESTIDHMSILAPDYHSNMPVKGKQSNPPTLTPKAYRVVPVQQYYPLIAGEGNY